MDDDYGGEIQPNSVRQAASASCTADDVRPTAPDLSGSTVSGNLKKADVADTKKTGKNLNRRQAVALLDSGIAKAFEQIENRGYADESKVTGKNVWLAAVSIVGKKHIKIKFKRA
ncbi:MAG: hypothetical protein LBQ79_05055 [Deltaproteobacteria bacterium]|nr:hypothetical protein [Deltaproteobacteria bacterium]